MTLIGFLVLLLIAAICGAIGQSLAGYDLGGCLVSIIVGFIGAYIGLWVAAKMGLPRLFEISVEGRPFPIVWAVIGSAIFTLVMGLLRRAFIGRNDLWFPVHSWKPCTYLLILYSGKYTPGIWPSICFRPIKAFSTHFIRKQIKYDCFKNIRQ